MSVNREMLENVLAPKAQKLSTQEYEVLTELLVSKDKELKETLKVTWHINLNKTML
jgi:hypothetical protein